MEKLENLFGRIFSSHPNSPNIPKNPNLLKIKFAWLRKMFYIKQIAFSKNKKSESIKLVEQIDRKINLAEEYIKEKKIPYAEITIFSIENLLNKI